jgi:hypothetical protein
VYGIAATIAGVIAEKKDIRTALVVGGIACFAAALATTRLAVPTSFKTAAS